MAPRQSNGALRALLRLFILIIALPVVIAVVIPVYLARRCGATLAAPTNFGAALVQGLGALVLVIGLALFVSAVYQIVARRHTSLAPWDPPRHLVIRGAYRWVRNPMISGVLFVLIGEVLLLRSLPHAVLVLVFLLLAVAYIRLLDEPQIEARFGDEYRRYRQHVSRLLPRARPWNPDTE